MRRFRYRVVDVFTERALEGNPLAVFPSASGLDPDTMQKIAKELNLAETSFVLPSTREDCAARVRIFTPVREMKFAGHPTIGTSFVLNDEGVVKAEHFALEELVGPVPVKLDGGMFWLETPPIEDGSVADRTLCAKVLGVSEADVLACEPQILSAGNPNLFVGLRSREAVDRCSFESAGYRALGLGNAYCMFVFTPTPEGAYSRMFAPEFGIVEDPATGSATGPLAEYMRRNGLLPGDRFVSEQGTKMGRRSLLHVRMDGPAIEVGGHVAPLVEAVMYLPD